MTLLFDLPCRWRSLAISNTPFAFSSPLRSPSSWVTPAPSADMLGINRKPRVSVIIPTYNGAKWIGKAINSILNQTYRDFEIIVVDDGSTDHTTQVLQPWRDWIHYIAQSNQGVAIARNRGLQQAQGEFIAFLDQDDWFLPDKLMSQVAMLEEHPNLGMVSSGWRVVNQQGETLSTVQPWEGIPQLTAEAWVHWKPVFLGATMFRASWLVMTGGFDNQFQQTSDVDLVLRLAMLGCEADWVRQATVCYRQHDMNTSRNAIQQAQELEATLDQFFAQPDLPPSLQQLESASRYQSLVWSAWQLYRYGQLAEMAIYLRKSLSWNTCPRTEAMQDWMTSFKRYAAEYGVEVDTFALVQSQEWRSLIQTCVLKF